MTDSPHTCPRCRHDPSGLCQPCSAAHARAERDDERLRDELRRVTAELLALGPDGLRILAAEIVAQWSAQDGCVLVQMVGVAGRRAGWPDTATSTLCETATVAASSVALDAARRGWT